ncbi:hypothetical protein DIPPA_56292 [Diplonema papillatum]|nr:hypothetical protein DIPPA_56292 [Diplonema papillatum]
MSAPYAGFTAEDVRQTKARLKDGLNPDSESQQKLVSWLQQFSSHPEFTKCLLYIVSVRSPEDSPDDNVREVAAYQVKKSISEFYPEAVRPVQDFVFEGLIAVLQNPSEEPPVSNAAATCLSALIGVSGLNSFPHVAQRMLDAYERTRQVAVLRCIRNICEDCAVQLDTPISETEGAPAECLLPGMLNLLVKHVQDTSFATTDSAIDGASYLLQGLAHLLDSESLVDAASAVNIFVQDHLQELLNFLHIVVEKLSVSQYVVPSTKQRLDAVIGCCIDCFRALLTFHADIAQLKAMDRILQSVLAASPDSASVIVVSKASHFWSEFASIRPAVQALSRVPRMIPQFVEMLLVRMVYSELELQLIEDDEEKDDIHPTRDPKSRDNDGDDAQWTTRKCSAAALDNLSRSLQDDFIQPQGTPAHWFFQLISARLSSSDWRQVEVGILALGAVASGAYTALLPYLPTAIPQLLAATSWENTETHPLVKSIGCWTLSQYEYYIVHEESGRHCQPYLLNLLDCMGHRKRKVQETAVAAFTCLVENEIDRVIETPGALDLITQKIVLLLTPGHTTSRELVTLLDAVSALTLGGGIKIDTPVVHRLLLQPLLHLLQTTNRDAPVFPRIMLTVRACVEGLGDRFAPYVPETAAVLGSILSGYFSHLAVPAADHEWNHPSFAFVVLQSLLERLPAQVAPLLSSPLKNSQFTLLSLAMSPLTTQLVVARQVVETAFNFLGACLVLFPQESLPVVSPHVQNILDRSKPDDPCSAACCSLAREIVRALGRVDKAIIHAASEIQAIATCAGNIVRSGSRGWSENVIEEAAVCLCTTGLLFPSEISRLPAFYDSLGSIGYSLAKHREGSAKIDAFSGYIALYNANFDQLFGTMAPSAAAGLGLALGGLRQRTPELEQSVTSLLMRIRQNASLWSAVIALFPPNAPLDILRRVDPGFTQPSAPPLPPPPQS